MVDSHTYSQMQDIPVEEPPERIVSLVPSITETLIELNLGKYLAGRTDYCIHPAGRVEMVPAVGGTKNPDIARIRALQPDLVIANQEENRREDVEALREAGIPVWVTFPRRVADVFNLMWNIMYLFDETLMVPRVRLIEYTYDWLDNLHGDDAELPSVFVPIWRDPWMTFNAETYMHDLLRVVGGRNVFADRVRQYPLRADLGEAEPYRPDDRRVEGRDTRYPRITTEEIIVAQPEVVLLPSEPFAFDESHISYFHSLDIPAAHQGRIHLVDGSLLTWHGIRVAYAMDQLPGIIRNGVA